jgi:predicted nucleotidyltransferase
MKSPFYTDSVIALVEYGSSVYGTAKPESDLDFVCILEDGIEFEPQKLTDLGDFNYYSVSQFQKLLNNQDITCLEAFYADKNFIHEGSFDTFTHVLDKNKLRSKFSERSSNSWVKAKKKLTVEVGQERIGLKSLFHSFRILAFGCQLAETGKIYDFSPCNKIYERILEIGPHWDTLEQEFKPMYNILHTRFKLLAPKS